MSRATSAIETLVPRVVAEYEKLGYCHPTGVSPSCRQCRLAAESIFQRMMSFWEAFLVDVIVDHIEGRPTGHYRPQHSVRRPRYSSRIDASNALLSTRRSSNGVVTHGGNPMAYKLFHEPTVVIDYVSYWMPNTDMEAVFSANSHIIRNILKIRHGLSHGTAHAQAELRATLLSYAPLRTYGSVGEFLLDRRAPTDPDLWIEVMIEQVCRFATEISP